MTGYDPEGRGCRERDFPAAPPIMEKRIEYMFGNRRSGYRYEEGRAEQEDVLCGQLREAHGTDRKERYV